MIPTTGSIPDAFISLNFEVVSGRQADPFVIEAIRDDLLTVLEMPHHAGLRDEITRQGGPNGKTTTLIRALIQNGGYASSDPFEAQVQTQVHLMIRAQNSHIRHELWDAFLGQYSEALASLIKASDEFFPDAEQILEAAQQLKIMTEQSTILGETLNVKLKRDDSRSGSIQMFSPNIIITLQIDQIQALYPFITNIIEAAEDYDPDAWPDKKDFSQTIKELSTAFQTFNNPFTFLKILQEYMFYHRTNIELSLGEWHSFFRPNPFHDDGLPHLLPVQPNELRRMIMSVLFLAARIGKTKDPIQLNFSWDQDRDTLEMYFQNFMTHGGLLWEDLEEILDGYTKREKWNVRQTTISGESIFVEIPTFKEIFQTQQPPQTRQPEEENVNRSVVLHPPAPVHTLVRGGGSTRALTSHPCLYDAHDAIVIGATKYMPRRIHPRATTFIGGLPFIPKPLPF